MMMIIIKVKNISVPYSYNASTSGHVANLCCLLQDINQVENKA